MYVRMHVRMYQHARAGSYASVGTFRTGTAITSTLASPPPQPSGVAPGKSIEARMHVTRLASESKAPSSAPRLRARCSVTSEAMMRRGCVLCTDQNLSQSSGLDL